MRFVLAAGPSRITLFHTQGISQGHIMWCYPIKLIEMAQEKNLKIYYNKLLSWLCQEPVHVGGGGGGLLYVHLVLRMQFPPSPTSIPYYALCVFALYMPHQSRSLCHPSFRSSYLSSRRSLCFSMLRMLRETLDISDVSQELAHVWICMAMVGACLFGHVFVCKFVRWLLEWDELCYFCQGFLLNEFFLLITTKGIIWTWKRLLCGVQGFVLGAHIVGLVDIVYYLEDRV